MPIEIDLSPVQELTAARRALAGHGRGQPRIQNGARVGASIQRASIVLMSAILQSFVEDVFVEISRGVIPQLNEDKYRRTFSRWGNPSPTNIENLFARLGIDDVLDGLSWRKCNNATVRRKLEMLNQLRNDIAHGQEQLRLDGQLFDLTQVTVSNLHQFCERFGDNFEGHIAGKL